ncbi:hypothetical protein [Alkalihalobacillus pseudalcaliphilus]|uniref:hypothetical protein n=1 Tax=Alkalihalobacillus pseudalcaliphilus TaxID=79884 RepID=UPI00235F911B|nr:hypothetical protein [Alkalihalobacillus pseudalcaliphilus]
METNYNDFSVHMSKEQLNQMVYEVMSDNYRIFWGFNEGKMILNIYNKEVNNKLTFIKRTGSMELIDVDVKSTTVEKALKKTTKDVAKHALKKKIKRERQVVEAEIDLELERLQWYLNQSDSVYVFNIKATLKELVEELEDSIT